MFSLLGMFFKEKVFKLSGVFIMFFAFIILTIIIGNSNLILTKLGFETTTTLKSQLTKSEDQVAQIADANKSTVDTLKTVEKINQQQLDAISGYYKEKELANKKITAIKVDAEIKRKVVNAKLDKSTVKTKTTITYNIEEYNASSSINIIMLNTAYEMAITEQISG